MSGEDKVAISRQLIALGVSYVEGGWPGSNPKDGAFFERWARELALDAAASGTKLAAFGSTRRRGTTAAEDAGCQALLACGAPCVTLVAKAWDEQARTPPYRLCRIRASLISRADVARDRWRRCWARAWRRTWR